MSFGSVFLWIQHEPIHFFQSHGLDQWCQAAFWNTSAKSPTWLEFMPNVSVHGTFRPNGSEWHSVLAPESWYFPSGTKNGLLENPTCPLYKTYNNSICSVCSWLFMYFQVFPIAMFDCWMVVASLKWLRYFIVVHIRLFGFTTSSISKSRSLSMGILGWSSSIFIPIHWVIVQAARFEFP